MNTFGKIYIFVDDIRNPNHIPVGMDCTICRDYMAAISELKKYISYGSEIIIDFDHDLGQKKSGYDIAKWIIEKDYPNIRFKIHSMNPVGCRNIRELLTHYGYKEI